MKNTRNIIAGAVGTTIAASPLVTLAQVGGSPPSSFSPNLTSLGTVIIDQVWIFFTIIAVICFVVAGIRFLTSGGDPDKVKEARDSFLWGVAGIAVGIIAYTIIAIVRGALGA